MFLELRILLSYHVTSEPATLSAKWPLLCGVMVYSACPRTS